METTKSEVGVLPLGLLEGHPKGDIQNMDTIRISDFFSHYQLSYITVCYPREKIRTSIFILLHIFNHWYLKRLYHNEIVLSHHFEPLLIL